MNFNTKIISLTPPLTIHPLVLVCCLLLIGTTGCGPAEKRKEPSIAKEHRLKIKDELGSLKPKKTGIYYKLKQGEGLYTVSRKFDLTIPDIIRENNIKNIYDIPSGTVLFIPRAPSAKAPETIDDTFEEISDNRLPEGNLPVNGQVIGKFHSYLNGIKLKGTEFRTTGKTPVYNVHRGVVTFSADSLGMFGPSLLITHSQNEYMFYGNVGRITVKSGQAVSAGTVIGIRKSGDAPLHIKLIRNNKFVDPEQIWR